MDRDTNKLFLRKAQAGDIDILFEWVNDTDTRENSFNTSTVNYDEHKEWFWRNYSDGNVDIYILAFDNSPIGQIRLNYSEDTAIISYSIDKSYRGKGYGKKLIELIENTIRESRPEIKTLIGYVKPNNIKSKTIFEHNNYIRMPNDDNCYIKHTT